jgi:hypothetical protein
MIIQTSSGACNCPLKVSAVTGMYGFNSTAKRQAMLQQIPITVLAWALETQETTSESKNFYKGESINKVNVSRASTQPLSQVTVSDNIANFKRKLWVIYVQTCSNAVLSS